MKLNPISNIFCRLSIALAVSLTISQGAVAQLSPSAAEVAALYQNPTTYRIFRKGKAIGSHQLNFEKTNDKLIVNIESSIRVTILKLPVFTFTYRASEQWQNNQLLSVVSSTVENGNKKEMSMRSSGTSSVLSNENRNSTVNRVNFATNHWHAGALQATRLFNTLTGQVSTNHSKFVGEEDVVTQSGTLPASRYAYDGDIDADVWYDRDGRWIKLRFAGNDGSTIEYIIDQESGL